MSALLAMAGSLFRPPPPALVDPDPDALAWITAVEAADGAGLETPVKIALDAFVKGAKADGFWSALQGACFFGAARTLAGALVPCRGAAPTNVGFEAGDYTRKVGIRGRTGCYLLSGVLDTELPQNSNHAAFLYYDLEDTNFFTFCGARNTAVPRFNFMGDRTGNRGLIRWQSNTQFQPTLAWPTEGFSGMCRTGASAYHLRAAGAQFNATHASTALTTPGLNLAVFGTNNDGVSVSSSSRYGLRWYSLGSGVTLSQMEARLAALAAALATAIP